MKAYKVLLISAVVFGLLLGGVLALQIRAQGINADVTCTPFFISLEDPILQEFRVTISLPSPYEHEDIDPDSILVGGVVPMKDVPDWPKIKKNYFAFKVDGWDLMYAIVLPQIWHMAPPPHTRVDIDIIVTGELYGGETFQGTFTLTVFTEKPDLDNPVPP